MGFGSALFLIGTAAAAIPLVLHLIHTTRAPRNPFPTLRFLRLAAEKTARRRRVQNVFLLLLRMALFALLAVALARPFLSPDLELLSSRTGTQAAIVLDESMSQSVTFGGTTRMQRTKREAEALLQGPLRPGEAALVATGGAEAGEAPAMVRDRDVLLQRVRQAEPGYELADMATALRSAYAALDRGAATSQRVYVFTDLQAASWRRIAEAEEIAGHPRVPLCVIHSDEEEFSNAAVVEVKAAGMDRVVGFPTPIEVTLGSTPNMRGERIVSLYVDDMDRPRERMAVAMPVERGKNDKVVFRPTLSGAGRHRVRVEIEAEDSLAVDNARLTVVDTKDHIRVLLVREARGLAGADDPVYYLERMMAAPAGAAAWAVEARVVSPEDLTGPLLAEADVIVMADVAAPSAELWASIGEVVRSGRTLIVFAGPFTDAARWNALAQGDGGLLPATLGEAAGRGAESAERARHGVAEVSAGVNMLSGLADPRYYQSVVVNRWWRLQPGATSGADVLLRLDDGSPLLLGSAAGRGRVYLFATPASGDWSNLQRTNIFLPLVLRMVHRSVERTDWPAAVTAGEPVVLDYAALGSQAMEVLVADPEHTTSQKRLTTTPTATTNAVRFAETLLPGFYEVTARPVEGGGDEVGWTFAVNPDGRESDLTPLGVEELRSRLPARELYVAASMADLQRQLKSLGRQELWQWFLTTVLLLAVFECLVSNRVRPRMEGSGVRTLVDRLRGGAKAGAGPREAEA